MKLISGQMHKSGVGAHVVESDSMPRRSKIVSTVVLGALAMSSLACASATDMARSTSNGPIGPPHDVKSDSLVAAPPPPPPPDPDADVITVSVPKPKAPIVENDAMGGEGAKMAQGDVDTDTAEEKQRARGAADPLQSVGNLEMATEGGLSAPGGSGIASNTKSAQRSTGAPPGPIPDKSGSTYSGGTQIAAASEVRGSIDKAEIRRVVMAHAGDIKRCYEQGLTRRPDLEGRVTLKFTIGKTGTVAAVTVTETTLNDRSTEQCIMRSASKWVFPKPTGEGLVNVSYPFILKSAD